MANDAAVTIKVQYRDGSTRSGVSVTCAGQRGTTDRHGNVTFTGLRAHSSYTASHGSDSVSFNAGQSTVVLTVR